MPSDETPFADLPAALVEELLGQTTSVAQELLTSFQQVRNERESLRSQLLESGLVITDSSLGYPPLPTTCGADGSYAIERLLTTDLAAAAAVAVEGLTPPSERRHWEQPHHSTYIAAETHHAETATVLRAVMLGRELLLAAQAPHDLVMIDGTLTLPVIYFNQALGQSADAPDLCCSKEFVSHCSEYLDAYRVVLRSERSDRNYIALPKYSTRRELGKMMGWPPSQDDRGLLTLILKGGELTKPLALEQPSQEWHLYTSRLPVESREKAGELAKEVLTALKDVYALYYKPHDWL